MHANMYFGASTGMCHTGLQYHTCTAPQNAEPDQTGSMQKVRKQHTGRDNLHSPHTSTPTNMSSLAQQRRLALLRKLFGNMGVKFLSFCATVLGDLLGVLEGFLASAPLLACLMPDTGLLTHFPEADFCLFAAGCSSASAASAALQLSVYC